MADFVVLQWAIRPATEADVLAVTAVEHAVPWGHWSSVAFSNELELQWSRTMVAVTMVGDTEDAPQERVIGFVVYWMLPGEVELLNIATHPRFQRHGIGRALVQHVLNDGREAGAERVVLEARASNTIAQALYERMGFKAYAVRKGYYAGNPEFPDQRSQREDAVLMACDLRQNPSP